MPNFKEELLQFIWRHKLLKPKQLTSVSGNLIEIIKPGELNLDSGPDFFNSQIRINNLLLAGNVEVHIYSSHWLKHKHQKDKNYDNIILHVVYVHDVELKQNLENNVEVLEIKDLIADQTLELYKSLAESRDKLPCAKQLKHLDDFKLISWLERMTIERLEQKVKHIESLFMTFDGDFTQTFYSLLLRSFGFKVNALPFELLSKHLPLHLLLKHADQLIQLEALLLGMCGLLQNQFEDKYIQNLQNEFEYLSKKYYLVPLQREIFKFSKLRPANFPTIRLVQFARLIFENRNIFVSPHQPSQLKQLQDALTISLDGYWQHHYNLSGDAAKKTMTLGKESRENLMINAFAPFYFFYSKKLNKSEFSEAALELLRSCEFENNIKTRLFSVKKSMLVNAAASQAIINLYDNYCVQKRCLKCGIASALLNR